MKRLRNALLAFVASLTLFFLAPMMASAHESAFTLKYIDGKNLVVATYNVHEVEPGLPITYNWRIYDTSGVPVAYKTMHISLVHGDKVVYEKMLKASGYNDSDWVYRYPENGEYMLHVHFMDGDTHIATGEFPILVEGHARGLPDGIINTQTLLAFAAGVVCVKAVDVARKQKMLVDFKRTFSK